MRGDAVGQVSDHRDTADVSPGRRGPFGNRGAPVIVDAAQRGIARMLAGEHARLHGGVVLHGAMSIKVIRCQIGEDADLRVEPRHQVDLEGGQLQHIDAALHRLAQQEHRLADIAADVHVEAGLLQHVADEGGGRRLAIRARDGDDARTCRRGLPREDPGIADHLDPGVTRLQHRPVRLGVGQRHAGAQHQGVHLAEVELVQVADRQASCPGLVDGRR